MVAPTQNSLSAEELYLYVYEIAIELAAIYNISYSDLFKEIKTIDVLKEYLNHHKVFDKIEFIDFYKKLLDEEKNIIFLNAPIDTPLAKESEYGIPLETKWAIGQRGIGHGYCDQNQISIIENLFKIQQEKLKEQGIEATIDKDYLMVLMYAGINTKSLNIGIDRLLYKFFNLEHEEKAIRILGI